MQKLFWIGNECFSAALQECGWDVATLPEDAFMRSGEQTSVLQTFHINNFSGAMPDVMVLPSMLLPFFPTISEFPCLTALYVAGHTPLPEEIAAAASVDICIVTASDYLGEFQNILPAERVLWLPPFAAKIPQPDFSSLNDMRCYLDSTDNSKDKHFIHKISQALDNLEILPKEEKYCQKARLILQTANTGEFNERLIEAMACGCCVVSPRVGNGLEKLFVDGEHFVGYANEDSGDAIYRISFLLENPQLIEHIGHSAAAEIARRHQVKHRAEAFTDFICDIFMNDHQAIINDRLQRKNKS